jgi:hypothetical protein
VEVPGVNDHPAGARIGEQYVDVTVVGLGLAERVVKRDVYRGGQRFVGVDLDDRDPLPVGLEHAGQAGEYDVVVVDERDPDR